jgi:type 1 glutamine amidotransferase
MKKLVVLVLTVFVCTSFKAERPKSPERILIFSLTKGFKHKSIPDGIKLIQKLGRENTFAVDTTTNSERFTYENLRRYSAVVFLSPTGEVFNADQKIAFKKYINKGGNFVGIHAATDCLYEWDWYGKLVGAYFQSHPKIQQATLSVVGAHPSTSMLPNPWVHTDEWYNFKSFSPDVTVLMTLDEKSYTGGNMGYHPIAWYHKFEGGRVFYTELGHTSECYTSDENFAKHLLGGIEYAIGRRK